MRKVWRQEWRICSLILGVKGLKAQPLQYLKEILISCVGNSTVWWGCAWTRWVLRFQLKLQPFLSFFSYHLPFLKFHLIIPDPSYNLLFTCSCSVLYRITGGPIISWNSVKCHPKISEEISSDSDPFRDFTAYHLLTTSWFLEIICEELRHFSAIN